MANITKSQHAVFQHRFPKITILYLNSLLRWCFGIDLDQLNSITFHRAWSCYILAIMYRSRTGERKTGKNGAQKKPK